MFSLVLSDRQWFQILVFCLSITLTVAFPSSAKSNISEYAPHSQRCPGGKLVRPANGLSPREKSYITQRKRRADRALVKWLQDVDDKFPARDLPIVAMASSGGGYRAMLLGAGVIQALDDRDSDSALNGVYQALTYHAGLSGGGWLLSSIHGNGHETISTLKEDLWDKFLPKNSLWPLNTDSAPEYPAIKADIQAKATAGFAPTITDVWGRFLSYQLLRGKDGGAEKTLSSISRWPNFRLHKSPFPIMTATSVTDITTSQCDPTHETLQYEFSPYEFGSWVSMIARVERDSC
jgi:lysophospholipase